MPLTDLIAVKNVFNIPPDTTYLNCAYMSPLTRHAVREGQEAVAAKLHPWNIPGQDFFTRTEQCRALFAQLLATHSDNIALVPAASYGLAVAAYNLPLERNKRILVLQDEFPSNYYIWQDLATARGGIVHTVPTPQDEDWTRAVLAEMDERTGIVAVPNCHWTDGGLVDLARIGARAREIGAALVVDATQSLGALPLDLASVQPDFLTAAGYKWMMGPYSYSYLYVHPRWHEGRPLEENWINRAHSENFARLVDYQSLYQPGARRYDVGERANFMLTPIAISAIESLLEWTVEGIAAHTGALTARAAERAEALGMHAKPAHLRAPHMIGITSPRLPRDVLPQLAARKIYVSRRGDSLRISPHVYNTPDDIDRLFDALGDMPG